MIPQKIEHIGIAVKDLEQAIAKYTLLLGTSPYRRELVESEGVEVVFFRIGESKIELLQSLTSEGAIARFIDKYGEGIHHMAWQVEDIRSEMSRLKQEGLRLLSVEPKRGAEDKWVCFIHPASAEGVLLELCQDIKKEA